MELNIFRISTKRNTKPADRHLSLITTYDSAVIVHGEVTSVGNNGEATVKTNQRLHMYCMPTTRYRLKVAGTVLSDSLANYVKSY